METTNLPTIVTTNLPPTIDTMVEPCNVAARVGGSAFGGVMATLLIELLLIVVIAILYCVIRKGKRR